MVFFKIHSQIKLKIFKPLLLYNFLSQKNSIFAQWKQIDRKK